MAKPSRENKASAAAPQRAAHGAPDAAGKASHGGRPRLANTAPTGYASTRALGGAAAAACLAAVIIVCIRHPLPLFDRALAAPPPAEPAAPARCLAVGVLSASGNRAARDAIRSTWQTHPDVCRLHYYIALPQHPMILSQVSSAAGVARHLPCGRVGALVSLCRRHADCCCPPAPPAPPALPPRSCTPRRWRTATWCWSTWRSTTATSRTRPWRS